MCDVAVASMDTYLLLDDAQRQQLKTAASNLVSIASKENESAESLFFRLFREDANFEILTPWQQGEFERVFGPIRIMAQMGQK